MKSAILTVLAIAAFCALSIFVEMNPLTIDTLDEAVLESVEKFPSGQCLTVFRVTPETKTYSTTKKDIYEQMLGCQPGTRVLLHLKSYYIAHHEVGLPEPPLFIGTDVDSVAIRQN